MTDGTDDLADDLRARVAAVTADVEEMQNRADAKIDQIRAVADKAVAEAGRLNELMQELSGLLERDDEQS